MKRNHEFVLCIALLIANLAFIWGNSALPADQSDSVSGWLQQLLAFLPDSEQAHVILRKTAHFAEFASLGLLWAWLQLLRQKQLSLSTLGAGLAVACIDETIQIFTPGRASALADVWLDTSGFATGLLVVLIGYTIYKHKFHLEDKK